MTTPSRFPALIALVWMLGAPALHAQHPLGYFDQWKDTAAARAPKAACRDLRSTTTYDFSIDAAATVPAKDPVPDQACFIAPVARARIERT